MTKLEYHPYADDELADAYQWYDAIDGAVGEQHHTMPQLADLTRLANKQQLKPDHIRRG